MNINLEEDGRISWIGDLDLDLPVENVIKRRVSHIVPVNPIKRAFFRVLRILFGESGRVSNWTRAWRGPWLVVIIETGSRFVHQSRSECIKWELEQLAQP